VFFSPLLFPFPIALLAGVRLVLSQFPSDLTEMLVLLGSGMMDLKHHTVLRGEGGREGGMEGRSEG